MAAASKGTPTALNSLYSRMLDRTAKADPAGYRIAKRAFSWLLCMQEPLSPDAFLAAVSISDSRERLELSMEELLAMCSHLIIVDLKSVTMRFSHASFKEFLQDMPEFNPANVNGIAAMSCLASCNNNTHKTTIESNTEHQPETQNEHNAAQNRARHY